MIKHNNKNQYIKNLRELLSEDLDSVIKREQSTFDNLVYPYNDRLVLFGAGGLGKKVLQGLRQIGTEPLAFVDNNPSFWQEKIDGLVVFDPKTASLRYGKDSVFIVTIWRAGGDHRLAKTQKQLYDLGCKKVISFASLFWKFPGIFLPYYTIGLPHLLIMQSSQILSAFNLLEDDNSRFEFIAQLRWRLHLDFDGLPSPVTHDQYFPDDLFTLISDEVFVDCGSFDGDSIRSFYQKKQVFNGKIFAIEPDPQNIKKLEMYLTSLDKSFKDSVSIIPKVVGRKYEILRFSANGSASSVIDPEGIIEVECSPIDDIVGHINPTFIKMDIEGAELDALNGATKSIRNSLPILAISVYHLPDHLWRIPLFINSVTDQYHYFLRPHNEEGWDLVLYAIPNERLLKS
jgi:FkbM family methyltransferase